MSRREIEFIERLNRLKQEDQSHPLSSNRLVGSLNEISEQLVKGHPKFIGHIDRQVSAAISRNNKVNIMQSETAPHILKQRDDDTLLPASGGEDMTGRSENVEDTHRSSMVDKRHIEQRSLRPVSREPAVRDEDGQLESEDLIADDLVVDHHKDAASNE